MRTRLALLGLLLLVAVVSLLLLGPWRASSHAAVSASPRGTGAQRPVEQPLELAFAADVQGADEPPRRASVVAEPTAAVVAAEPLVWRTVTGRVLDTDGRPAAGIALELISSGEASPMRTTTDELSSFTVEATQHARDLRCADPEWTNVLQPDVREPDPSDGYLLVVARHAALAGVVVDVAGTPIPDVQLRFERTGMRYTDLEGGPPGAGFRMSFASTDPLRSALDADLERSSAAQWTATSDREGCFRFDDVPRIEGSHVKARKGGFQELRHEVEAWDAPLELVLQREVEQPGKLRGRVVDERGEGQDGARIYLGTRMTYSDDQGGFEIDAKHTGARSLVAAKRGYEPAQLACARPRTDDPGAWPEPLVLVLGYGGASFRGRVVGADGAPRADVEVHALESTTGGELLALLGEQQEVAEAHGQRPICDDGVYSDAEGRFEIGAVLRHPRRLRAHDRATLEVVVTEEFVPGAGEVVIRMAAPVVRMAGRVVDPRGEPVAGAQVAVRRELPSSNGPGVQGFEGASVTADEQGRFEIPRAAADVELAQVKVESGAVWEVVPIDPGAPRQDLVLRVGRGCRLVVDASELAGVNRFRVLDAKGTALGIGESLGGGGWRGSHQWGLVEGRSGRVIVSESAATLVLLEHANERARVPLRLVPGEVTVVRP